MTSNGLWTKHISQCKKKQLQITWNSAILFANNKRLYERTTVWDERF